MNDPFGEILSSFLDSGFQRFLEVISVGENSLQIVQTMFLRLAMIIIAIFGLIQCFLGYRFFKYVLVLAGGLIGALIGSGLCFLIPPCPGVRIVFPVFFAVLLSLFHYWAYCFGLFTFGSSIGFLVFVLLTRNMAFSILSATIAGIFFVALNKTIIRLFCSYSGAFLAAFAALQFTSNTISAYSTLHLKDMTRTIEAFHMIFAITGIVLGTVGFVYQMGCAKKPLKMARNTTSLLQ